MSERLTRVARNECGSGVSKEPLIDREGYPVISAYAYKILTKLADFEDAEESKNTGCEYCDDSDYKFLIKKTIHNKYGDAVEWLKDEISLCPVCGHKLSEVTDAKK